MGAVNGEDYLKQWSNAGRVLRKVDSLVRKNLEEINSFKVYGMSDGCLSGKKYDTLFGYIHHALSVVNVYSSMYEPELLARRIVNKL